MKKPTIMIVDDDPSIRFAFSRTFTEKKYFIQEVEDGLSALRMLEKNKPSLIFLDISMPDMDGLDVLKQIKKKNSDIPVIMITGYGTMQTAMKAIQLGAFEYLTKPLDIDKVRQLATRALDMVHKSHSLQNIKSQVFRTTEKFELIGTSETMQEVYKKMGAAASAPNTTNILIQGESGTGKELVARAIHANSEFAEEPFVAINCTALPDNLFESEMFGYEKGSFTGADARRIGLIEKAGRGSLFLDEIGSLSLYLQQKLLRILQQREFRRVGGREPIPIQARFIAATNHSLPAEVEAGRFRKDLFYRLNVLVINLPPLRQRRDDIRLLADFFLNRFNQKMNKKIRAISEDVYNYLFTYEFHGNVRELENMMERAMILEKGEILSIDSLKSGFASHLRNSDEFPPIHTENYQQARSHWLAEFERRFLCERLQESHGNVTLAAEQSGIQRQSFQRLMKKYGIHSKDFRDR